jgi:hypothetical protein
MVEILWDSSIAADVKRLAMRGVRIWPLSEGWNAVECVKPDALSSYFLPLPAQQWSSSECSSLNQWNSMGSITSQEAGPEAVSWTQRSWRWLKISWICRKSRYIGTKSFPISSKLGRETQKQPYRSKPKRKGGIKQAGISWVIIWHCPPKHSRQFETLSYFIATLAAVAFPLMDTPFQQKSTIHQRTNPMLGNEHCLNLGRGGYDCVPLYCLSWFAFLAAFQVGDSTSRDDYDD